MEWQQQANQSYQVIFSDEGKTEQSVFVQLLINMCGIQYHGSSKYK